MKLDQLENVIKNVDGLENFAPPVTLSCLVRAEELLGRPLPPQLRELYLWRNGQPEIGTTLIQNWRFMPLHELIESHRILLDSADDWSEDWFPFAANGGGDHLFADGDGRVREYWHADKDRSVINENLAAWVDDVIAEVGRSQCQSGLEAWDKVDLYLEKAPDGGNQALLKLKKELKLQMGISKLAHLSKNAPVLLMEGIYFVHAKRYCKVLPCLGVRKTGKVEDR